MSGLKCLIELSVSPPAPLPEVMEHRKEGYESDVEHPSNISSGSSDDESFGMDISTVADVRVCMCSSLPAMRIIIVPFKIIVRFKKVVNLALKSLSKNGYTFSDVYTLKLLLIVVTNFSDLAH